MSYLKSIVKTVALVVIAVNFTACKEDGGFVAKDFSVKQNTDQPASDVKENVLSEEQIKALAEANEKRSKELAEEIALKNEVITNLQIQNKNNSADLEQLKAELERILSDNSIGDKEEKIKNLGAQIAALTELIEKDRAEYTKALESVSHNDEQIVKSISNIINEINKSRKQKGSITDTELLEIEKRLLAQMEAIKKNKDIQKAEITQDIQSIDAELERVNSDIATIEEALENNPPDQQNILNALNELKAKKAELELQKSSNVEQKDDADTRIIEINCVTGSDDCEDSAQAAAEVTQKPVVEPSASTDKIKANILEAEASVKKYKEEKANLESMRSAITADIARIDNLILDAKMSGKIPPMVVGLERDKATQLDNLAAVQEKIDNVSITIAAWSKTLAVLKTK